MGRYSNPGSEKISQLRALRSQCPPPPSSEVHHAARSKQKQTRLRPEEVDLVVAAYQAGSTRAEVATQFGIHKNTVTDHLERRGVPRRLQSLTHSQVDKAAKLYKHGWSLARIGEHFQVDPSTVWRAFRRARVKMRPRAGWSDD